MNDDPFDGGMFISGDRFSRSVPWRLDEYGWGGALSSEQIDVLSRKFGIDTRSLADLSQKIGRALDVNEPVNLVHAPLSKGAARAAKEAEQSLKNLGTAYEKLSEARDRLAPLYPNRDRNPEGAAHFTRALALMRQCERHLEEAENALQDAMRLGQFALVVAPGDKRTIADVRRKQVLRHIFQFWHDADLTGRFTTDPDTSKRRGPIIDFANAIVECVTDPPRRLSPNTIVAELRRFKPITKEYIEQLEAALNRGEDKEPPRDA